MAHQAVPDHDHRSEYFAMMARHGDSPTNLAPSHFGKSSITSFYHFRTANSQFERWNGGMHGRNQAVRKYRVLWSSFTPGHRISYLGTEDWSHSSRHRASSALKMPKEKGTLNHGMSRAKLLDLIDKSGLDIVRICKMAGESTTQPPKKLLEQVAAKYNLLGSASKDVEGPLSGFLRKKSNVEDSAKIDDDEQDEDEDPEYVEDIPLNQEAIISVSDTPEYEQSKMEEAISTPEAQPSKEGGTHSTLEAEQSKVEEAISTLEAQPNKEGGAHKGLDWDPSLMALGYGNTHIVPPNKAVQIMLGCIMKAEIHKYLIKKETFLGDEDISAITFLGINNMMDMVSKVNKPGCNLIAAMKIIDAVYEALPMAHAEAQDKELRDVLNFVKVAGALELTNNARVAHPPRGKKPKPKQKPMPKRPVPTSNCLFDLNMLDQEEQKELMGESTTENHVDDTSEELDDVAKQLEDYNIKSLTLYNCRHFPIMSARLVELHGVTCRQALWETGNLGALAPLSEATLRSLMSITDAEVDQAHKDAINFRRRISKIDVTLPFRNTTFFGKKCDKDNGIYIGQKGHMANAKVGRDSFYINLIWRTFCPYLKCRCDRFGGNSYSKNEEELCKDHITWYDQAVWYIMNSMDKIWSNKSSTHKFQKFYEMMNSSPMRTAGVAFIGYLKVRQTMINMAIRYAEDKDANLKTEFGSSKLAEILERTLKSKEFLLDALNMEQEEKYRNNNYKRKGKNTDDEEIQIVMPPIVKKRTSDASTRSTNFGSTEVQNLACNTGCSVNKGNTNTEVRTAGVLQTKLTF